MKKNTKGIVITVVALILFAIVAYVLFVQYTKPKKMDYNELIGYLQADENGKVDVKSIKINNDTFTIKLHSNSKTYETFGREEDLLAHIRDMTWEDTDGNIHKFDRSQIKMTFNDRYATNPWTIINYVIMGLFVVFILFMLFRGLGSGDRKILNFGKSGVSSHQPLRVRFADVAGAEEEKEELAEIVEFLKTPQKFIAAGARIPRGVLLVGHPGTGKTLFAKAVAGEAGVPFFSISGSDFVEMYVGVGASRVRNLFEVAKRSKPCIIFIDEIDAVGRQRGAGLGGGHDEREQTLNQLLVQMDGFDTNDDIIVMAATNRADILDPALLRPGRFDRQIYVNIPDVRGREEIFKVHARNKNMGEGVDFQILARITSGFTGADIANLLNEAAILAARDNRITINMPDIYEGINKVTMGPQKKSRLITEVDKRNTAYHEAGHAVVAKILPHSDPVHEVSIIPRGRALGYTAFRPENDNRDDTINRLSADLAISMGGRAAEEIVIKDISAGAYGDIRHATALARKMVTEWGMSSLGPIFYGGNQEVFLGRDYGSSHSYSESIAAKIDAEVEKIIGTAYKTAFDVLTANKDKMDVMVRVLFEVETIFAEEVGMIMDGKSAQEVIDSIKAKNKK